VSNPSVRPDQSQLDQLILEIRPGQGQWRDEDYLWLTDHTSRLLELTDGFLEVLPMPTDHHQAMLGFLFELLLVWARRRGGTVRVAPLRLRIREGKFREPDLLLMLDSQDPRRGDRYWTGADLVIEIVSPDRPERDLIDKRADYAEAGVPEYWIVDPRAEQVTVLVQESGSSYQEEGTYGRGCAAASARLPELTVRVSDLMDAD